GHVEGELPIIHRHGLWRWFLTRSTQLLDLGAGGEGWTAHLVVSREHVAVLGIEPPHRRGRPGGEMRHVDVEVLRRAFRGAGRVFGAVADRWRVVPQREYQRAVGAAGGERTAGF